MGRHTRTPKWLQAARTRQGAPANDWLIRALSRAGHLSPLQAEEALRDGRVKLDGRVTREALSPVTAESRVQLDSKDISIAPTTIVLAFNKPSGVVTAATDQEDIGTVFDVLFRTMPKDLMNYAWHAVGRLDRDTTGLLLFTNDEQFVAWATNPESHISKTYVAKVSGKITADKLKLLSDGMDLVDGYTRPAKASQLKDDVVQLVLTEGRNHQVKRMLNEVGLPTLQLHREFVGEVQVDVAEGEFRKLTDEEIVQKLQYQPRHLKSEVAPPGTKEE